MELFGGSLRAQKTARLSMVVNDFRGVVVFLRNSTCLSFALRFGSEGVLVI